MVKEHRFVISVVYLDFRLKHIHFADSYARRRSDRCFQSEFRKYECQISRLGRIDAEGRLCFGCHSLPLIPMARTYQCVNKSVKTFVIDTEAVAYDIKEKKLLPFQQLTTRKRKDVRTEDITVRVHIFAFDLLYLNGEVSQLDHADRIQLDRSLSFW